MKPKIVRVEDLKVFDKVAKVLGKSQAKIELFKVANHKDSYFKDRYFVNSCFTWSDSPQGYSFWSMIHHKSLA